MRVLHNKIMNIACIVVYKNEVGPNKNEITYVYCEKRVHPNSCVPR